MRALYREHAGPLLAYVLRLVAGDRRRAEDVVQETLIRAWKNAGSLNRATGFARPHFRGRTVNEAAEVLGIPSGTVRSRVFYALRSMKLALEERGITA
jgi:DNA-directed RNA polymerase specialized sigma24 family protein